MTEGDDNLYVGVPQPDGNIRVEGPMDNKGFKTKLKNEKGPTVGVMAENQGNAVLKILSNIISKERSKK